MTTTKEAWEIYVDKGVATEYAFICQPDGDTITAVIMSAEVAKEVGAPAVKWDAKSTGGEHLRGITMALRNSILAHCGHKLTACPDFQIIRLGSPDEIRQQYEAWRAGRPKAAYNLGNFAEWLLAVRLGDINHPHRNLNDTKTEADIEIDGRKIEVKGQYLTCSFQADPNRLTK